MVYRGLVCKNIWLKEGKRLGFRATNCDGTTHPKLQEQIKQKPKLGVFSIRTRDMQENPKRDIRNQLFSRKRAVAEATMLERMA